MLIGEVLNTVYDDDVGWRPASGGIKPVHVANGLVRALVGRVHDTSRINKFIVWWRAGRIADDARTAAALIAEDDEGVFAGLGGPKALERARRYATGLLTADGAVFPRADMSSLTLTCAQMASSDHNDRGLGDFGAALLTSSARASALADAVRQALVSDRPRDPVTAFVWPLLDGEGRPYERKDKSDRALARPHNRDVVARLQDAASDLASHERAQGNRLRTLERAVHFVCLATHTQATWLAGAASEAGRQPLLLALAGQRRDDLALASEQSVDRGYELFERWLGDRLSDRIGRGRALWQDQEPIELSTDGRAVRCLLQRIRIRKAKGSKSGEEEEEIEDLPKDLIDERMADFETARSEFGREEAARVLGHTLVRIYSREYYSGGPRSFLQALARRCGFLYPHFSGRAREKRVRPSVPVLDMLVRACVTAGQPVPLDDFLGRLWDRFGLIVGGRQHADWHDGEALRRSGISADSSALISNTDELVRQLVSMGLARRYADNVTFVGDGHVA